jgi:hypothetical protein
MWSKRRSIFRNYRLINLAIGAYLVMVMMYFSVASFYSMETLEKQRLPLFVSGVETVVESSRMLLDEKRNLQDSGGINNYLKSPPATDDKDMLDEKIDIDTSSALNHRFILFRKLERGQGAGNIMNGLLAAHLLGQEFNRTVCVEDGYTGFHVAFEAIDPFAMKYCPNIMAALMLNNEGQQSSRLLELVNFDDNVVDECSLQGQLASPTIQVIEYIGNTYPRWPRIRESNFFFRHYRARPALLDILPYDDRGEQPPSAVVHLRAPDPNEDNRRNGLDEDSLVALGAELPRNATFLVTNNVDWYTRFEQDFGWSHSNWTSVIHSRGHFAWQDGVGTYLPAPIDQIMQLWADWYILLRAKKVYHTHSDFSSSAVHWMSIHDSFVIEGYNTTSQRLILKREAWLLNDGESPALCTRTTDPEVDSSTNRGMQLRGCAPERNFLREIGRGDIRTRIKNRRQQLNTNEYDYQKK